MASRTRWAVGAKGRVAGILSGLALVVGIAVPAGPASALNLGQAYLTVCKASTVSGSFSFSLNSGTPVSIAAGTCRTLEVENGHNTVTELPDPTGGTQLGSIAVSPSLDTVASSVAQRAVTVNIPVQQTATVTFTNVPVVQVEVCKIAGSPALLGQSFDYTVTPAGGSPTRLSAFAGPATAPGCSTPVTYAPGTAVTVAEQLPVGVSVSAITAAGAGGCTTSVSAGTATCTLGTAGLTTVTYTNDNEPQLEVCKIAGSSPLLGRSFDYTLTPTGGSPTRVSAVAGPAATPGCSTPVAYPSNTAVTVAEQLPAGVSVSAITAGGTGSCTTSVGAGTAACTLGATGLTTLTYTNTDEPQIEVCKIAGSSALLGRSFAYTVTPAGGSPTQVSAVAGPAATPGCSAPVVYGADQVVTVAEHLPAGVSVSAITADGTGSCTTSVPAGTAACTLGATGLTTLTYTNLSQPPQVEVCKIAGSSALLGRSFDYAVTPAGGSPTQVSAVAGPATTPGCSLPVAYPSGTAVTVAEQLPAGVSVSAITAGGTGSCTTSVSAGTAACTLGATGLTTLTYTNTNQPPTGWLEVCKVAADSAVAHQSFDFSVNGGPVFTVAAGHCSAPLEVPSGPATVDEIQANPDFYLKSVSTLSATDPTGARRLTGPDADPATVSVPAGGVGDETVVTFTDATVQSVLKICTGQTSPGANLGGVLMPYQYSYTVNGATTTGTVSLLTPMLGATCSLPIGTFNAVNDDGSAVRITVTAGKPPVTAVALAGFQYLGNGAVISAPTYPASFPATVSVAGGRGVNVMTFTDGAAH